MSWQASHWAVKAPIPATLPGQPGASASAAAAKAVLLILAEAADKDGSGVILAQRTIADRAEMSPRAVGYAMQRLEAAGLIVRDRRNRPTDGGRTSDAVTLAMPAQAQDLQGGQAQDLQGPAATFAGGHPQDLRTITRSELTDQVTQPSLCAPRDLFPGAKVVALAEVQRTAAAKKARRREETALTDSWRPPEDAYDYGAEHGLTSQEVELETETFRNHARANDRRQRDWEAAWRNWILQAVKFKAGRRAQGVSGQQNRASAMDWALRAAEEPA